MTPENHQKRMYRSPRQIERDDEFMRVQLNAFKEEIIADHGGHPLQEAAAQSASIERYEALVPTEVIKVGTLLAHTRNDPMRQDGWGLAA